MATAIVDQNTGNGKRRNAGPVYVSKIDLIRSTILSLLKEAELQAPPAALDSGDGIDFYEHVALYEAHLIESALRLTGGRQNRAAKLLGLRNSTLSCKIKKLEIRGR
ncbi:MAG TPA: helix-turn-helix domain-containing protein [Pyrinomonadaceae bacterium]|nr:helix-turn-helix domain-containing protein [Pyrinomonadaceae bacterium]